MSDLGPREARVREELAVLHPARIPRNTGRIGLVLVAVLFILFAALGIYAAGLHKGTGISAQSVELTLKGGQLSPAEVSVPEGDQVVLSVRADRSATLRLEGYDLQIIVNPTVPVVVSFVATRTGTFNFVVEGSTSPAGKLTVRSR